MYQIRINVLFDIFCSLSVISVNVTLTTGFFLPGLEKMTGRNGKKKGKKRFSKFFPILNRTNSPCRPAGEDE